VIIREAHPEELAEVGDLRVAAYVADGFLAENSGYTPRLRSLGADGTGTVLVAVLDDEIAGTVMIQAGSDAAEVVQGPDEAGFRRLPERDWSPQPGIMLIAYGLRLDEPPAERPAGAA
jgi:hypothetical protein